MQEGEIMNIEQAKEKVNVRTSEQLFGIPTPPEHQCKNIDKVIKTIKAIHKSTDNPRKMDEDELIELVNDIHYDLHGIDDDIEAIRSALEDVREWGQQWKNKCKEIIDRYELDVEEIV